MEKSIWLFGCSFTNTEQMAEVLLYNSSEIHPRYLHWGDYVLQYFNELGSSQYKLRNFGVAGLSMKFIMYSLLNVLDKIKPGDVVIVGNTTGDRVGYLKSFDEKEDKLHIDLFNVWSWFKDKDNLILSDTGYDDKLGHILGMHFDAINSMSPYSFNALTHEEELNNKILHSVLKLLSNQNITTYMWDYTIWQAIPSGKINTDPEISIFETIESWSGYKIDDRHWSPNGNRIAADFFIWCIKNNYNYFAYQFIPEWWKNYKEDFSVYINYPYKNKKS